MFQLPKVLNCKAAAEMSCRRRDGTLTRGQRTTLAIHLLMCAGCRLMDRQFALLDRAAKQLRYRGLLSKAPVENTLSPEARKKIETLLR
ncbi:MAG: hypothetical protein HKL95_03885 [Phycisphaerae bacterium]|nr:hypothetical protein [Phycisphaerae bacterium]